MVQRRRHNKIVDVMNDAGEWLMDDASLKAYDIEFFRNLYTDDSSAIDPLILSASFRY